MRSRLVFAGVVIICIGVNTERAIAQIVWQLKKDVAGIRVFTRQQSSSQIKELKIETTLEASLSNVAALLNDANNYQNWVYRVTSSRIVKKISHTQLVYYSKIDFPWPLSDRELYALSEMHLDSSTSQLIFESTIWRHAPPPSEEVVRIPYYFSKWVFTPLDSGLLRLEYYLQSDPGGMIPAWLINLAIDQGPIATIKALKYVVKRPPYNDRELAKIGDQ